MIVTWIFFIFQLFIVGFIDRFFENTAWLAWVVIGLTTIVFSLYLFKYSNKLRVILYGAYILRVLTMIVDIYGRNIINLPHSGIDSENFFSASVSISNNLNLLNGPIYGSWYSKIMGIVFRISLPNRLIAQYINILLGMTVIFILYKILIMITQNSKVSAIGIILYAFLPHSIILSSIFLREILITALGVISFYYFICWFKKGGFINVLYSTVFLLLASVFHSGMIGILIGYVYAFLFYDYKTEQNKFSQKSIFYFTLFIIFFIFLFSFDSSILFSKFNKIKEFEDIYLQANVRGGGSKYLSGLEVNSFISFVFYSPIRALFFLLSPLPIYWRGISDIVSFMLDSIVYLHLLFYSIKYRKDVVKNKKIYIIIAIILITVSIVFGIGIANAGTAMRHRQKIFYLLLSLYIVVVNERKIQSNRE